MNKEKYTFGATLLSIVKALGFVAFWFVLTQIISIIFSVFITLANFGSDLYSIESLIYSKSNEILIISNMLALICFALFYKILKKPFTERCLINHQPIGVYIRAIALGFVGQYAINLILGLLMSVMPQSWIDALEQNNAAITNSSPAAMFVATVIAAPLLEEIMCRSLMLGSLREGMPKWWAIVVSSIIFGVLHGNPIGIIYATLFGILLGWLTTRFNSVVPSILCHMAFNLTSLILSESGGTTFDSIMLLVSVPLLIYLIRSTNNYEPNIQE